MYCTLRTSVVVVVFLFTAASLRAQTAVDPSGHWEGLVQVPGMDIAFQIDFAKSGSGITGAVSVPAQQLTGLPLQKVVVDGRSIEFQARTDQSFDGTMSSATRNVTARAWSAITRSDTSLRSAAP